MYIDTSNSSATNLWNLKIYFIKFGDIFCIIVTLWSIPVDEYVDKILCFLNGKTLLNCQYFHLKLFINEKGKFSCDSAINIM